MFGRRRPPVVRGARPSMTVSDEASAVLAAYTRAAQAGEYAKGIRDGIETTLRLLLGEPADGGVPFAGELPADVEEWARTALGRLP